MRSLLTAPLLTLSAVLLLAGPVLAGDLKFCPSQRAATEPRAVAIESDETGSTARPLQAREAPRGGGDAAATTPRLRPRWQSYLPGMMR